MQDMDAVYRQHFRMVYQYLMSLTHQPDVAEELAQETFCQAVSSIHRYDGSCKITTWLCAIAKNQYLSYLRKHPLHEDLTPKRNFRTHRLQSRRRFPPPEKWNCCNACTSFRNPTGK